MHIITLSFDDGFRGSSIRTAEIFERRGLHACMNVIARGFSPDAMPADDWKPAADFGDWGLWKDLHARGHEIGPHGYRHANKAMLSFDEGRKSILACLAIFDRELPGFDRHKSVFNFPYNRTTPELEAWLPSEVRAFRGGGIAHGLNPIPTRQTRVMRTTGMGPQNCESHLDACIAHLLEQPEGWLVYNTHGLDGEGWGPIGSAYLESLLDRLMTIESVRLWTASQTLMWADGLRTGCG